MHTAPVRPREPPTTSTWPESNLVELGVRRGREGEHAAGDHAGRGLARRAARDPDLGHAKLAGVRLPRRDPVPQLGPVEAHRDVGLHRHPLHLARRRIHARGDVGRHDRSATAVDGLDRGVRGRARRPREPGAEDRVHDHPGALERAARAPPGPPGPRRSGIARGWPSRRRRARPPATAGAPPPRTRSRPAAERTPARRRRCFPCRRRRAPVPAAPRSGRPPPPRRPPSPSTRARAPRCSSIAQASAARIPVAS